MRLLVPQKELERRLFIDDSNWLCTETRTPFLSKASYHTWPRWKERQSLFSVAVAIAAVSNPRRSFLWLRLWRRSRQPLVCLLRCAKAAGKLGREDAGNPQWLHTISQPEGFVQSTLARWAVPQPSEVLSAGPSWTAAPAPLTAAPSLASVCSPSLSSFPHLVLFLLSRRLGPVEISPLVHHLYWMCLFGGDAPSLRYPATWRICECVFLIAVMKRRSPKFGASFCGGIFFLSFFLEVMNGRFVSATGILSLSWLFTQIRHSPLSIQED